MSRQGTFVNGVLHGDSCSIRRSNGDTYSGRFEHGELSGFGKLISDAGDFTVGDFCFGESHGFCTSFYKDLGVYTGFYTWGMRSGKGELRFDPVEGTADDLEDRAINTENLKISKFNDKFKCRFCGYMIADLIASGGLQVSIESGIPSSINRRVESISRRLDVIGKKLYQRTLRRRRDKEKMTFMETHVRQDISMLPLIHTIQLNASFSKEEA